MIGSILAGCLVAIVVVVIIMLLASWDRTERRMRGDDYALPPFHLVIAMSLPPSHLGITLPYPVLLSYDHVLPLSHPFITMSYPFLNLFFLVNIISQYWIHQPER